MGVMDALNVGNARSSLNTSDFVELTRRVRMAGGHQLADACEAVNHAFEPTHDVPASEDAAGGPVAPAAGHHRGTGCGRQRKLAVPYLTPTFDRRRGVLQPTGEVQRELVVCADDDYVAYWPRFAGRRGED